MIILFICITLFVAVGLAALAAFIWTRAAEARNGRAVASRLCDEAGGEPFDPIEIASLPEPVQRFFTHAIAPGTPLRTAATIEMHGGFRMAQDKPWFALKAWQRIAGHRGFVWKAQVRRRRAVFHGTDYLVAGERAGMRIWLWGLVPVVCASGPDIARSSIGRLASEMLWTPAALLPRFGVQWEVPAENVISAHFSIAGEDIALHLRCEESGAAAALWLDRWRADKEGGPPAYVPFGAAIKAYGAFDGYTVPVQLEGGWGWGTQEYVPFVRYVVDTVRFEK
jgi:hypothetical protein